MVLTKQIQNFADLKKNKNHSKFLGYGHKKYFEL
jgi:hypothetical protein